MFDNIPYIKHIKLALIGALVLGLVVQTIRVAHRDTTIAEKGAEITAWMSNCTAQETELELLQESQRTDNATIAGLQDQVTAKDAAIQQYRENLAEQQAIMAGAHDVPAEPMQKTGEVVDDETSRKIIHFLNAVFARVGVLRD